MKKFLTLLTMSIFLMLSTGKINAQTVIAQGTTDSLTWVLTSDNVLTISGSGAIPDYNEDDSLWYAYDSIIVRVVIGDSVTRIGEYVFSYCADLASVTIGNAVTTIGECTFQGCENLTSITIPNSVTKIEDYAFYACTGLTTVTLGNSLKTIGESAFEDCSDLTTVTIPNSVTTIGDYAFYDCTDLTTVTLSNSLTTIGEGMFEGCYRLTSITIPHSVTSIRDYAFAYCLSLTSVTLGNLITAIGEGAFQGCENLISVTLGGSVTMIDNWAFAGCERLAEIINLNPTPIAINGTVFEDVDKSTCVLKVPAGSLAAYSAANVWKEFLNMEEISVAITEVQRTASLQMYPNPVANGKITVSNGEGKAEIYTMQGVQVGSYSLTDKETTIDISHLASGVYFVKVGSTTKKLIVGK
jgi:hypothetical protein